MLGEPLIEDCPRDEFLTNLSYESLREMVASSFEQRPKRYALYLRYRDESGQIVGFVVS